MLLYGASGHAKVIISCLRANGIEVLAIFDDDVSKKELWGIPVMGSYNPDFEPIQPLIISIGFNGIRQKIAGIVKHSIAQIIHSSAEVDDSVRVGEGSVIFQSATIQTDTVIGKHCIINTSASVDHDCQIADFAHIAPNATLCGNVRVGAGTLIGAGSIIAPNLTIGSGCMIAAGSVITRNIPDFAVVRGNPGRVIKIIT
jgi:sugar O-acyltransferase (sialic acid O-acetyltransferase NeuD family)